MQVEPSLSVQTLKPQTNATHPVKPGMLLLLLPFSVLLFQMQVESSLNVQTLKPQTDLIKRRYGSDKERIQRETSALYEKAGVNPLAGELRL